MLGSTVMGMQKFRNCCFAIFILCGPIAWPQMQPAEIHLNANDTLHFVAYGDTRFTNPNNTKAANPDARRELVKAIARAHPDFVTFGGDITYNGNDPEDWKVYDAETAV